MKRLICLLMVFNFHYLLAQNPQLLKDVFPGNNSGTIQNIVKTTGFTFFNEDDNDADGFPSLFRTDGTNAGTLKIDLIAPGYTGLKVEKLTPLGDKIIFSGDNSVNYGEIWVSDGTAVGTSPVEKFQPTTLNQPPIGELQGMGNYVYYKSVDNNNHAVLKRTDGSVAGTSLVYEFSAFSGVPQVLLFKPLNDILYFIVYDQAGSGADQLWRSDGTTAGTYMVYNFTTANFVESFIMPAGNSIYLMIGSVVGGVRQNTIWKSDGTNAGTVPVKLVGTGNTNTYPPFAAIGSTLYFAGLDGNGKELWQTDGTPAGTYMVADINPGVGGSNPLGLTVLNNVLYFSAGNPTNGGELWKCSNGVASLVKDINPGAAGSGPGGLTISNNTIIFNANNGVNGGELWISDGTADNTVMIADINPGAANSIPNSFTPGNPVFFAANDGINGFEVFKYINDGKVLAGPHRFYVNDNTTTGDVFTTGVGNNANNGSIAYPFATISYAITKVQADDTIYVDAGSYTEQVTLDKGIVIIGAGKDVTSILTPTVTVAPPGTFIEKGIIQTAQAIIGDVHLRDLSATGDYGVGITPVILQTGGSIKNCKFQNGNQGVFIRIDYTVNPANKVAYLENNIIQAEYIGVNYEGINLQGHLVNNNISVSNPGFSAGAFIGGDVGGALSQFTATGNYFTNYATKGIQIFSNNTSINNNSFSGNGFAIERVGGNTTPNATCNWYGSASQNIIQSKISGTINYSPWLTNGTDNDPAIGFQPFPGSCNGTVVGISVTQVTHINCFGQNTGAINITVTGGLAPFSFAWTKIGDAGYSATSEDINNLTAGTYRIVVTDLNGSTSSRNILVNQPAAALAINLTATNITCFGANNGSIAATVSGGTTPYTYQWSNGSTNSSISGLAAGSYTVVVNDAKGCNLSAGYNVIEPPLLTVTMSGTVASCNGSATATPEGGTVPYTYLWNNGATTQAISNVPVGDYSVVVTDSNGCTANGAYTITGNSPINPTTTQVNVSCFGTSTGSITITGTNSGTAPFTYNINGTAFQPGNVFNNLSAGTYIIGVKDANGCSDFVSRTVTQPPLLTVALDNTISPCGTANNGEINIIVSGGTGGKTYNWTGPNGYTSNTRNPNHLFAGMYNVTVTDAKGCIATLAINLIASPQILVSEVITHVNCRGNATGAIDATVTGGSGAGFTFRWTLGGGAFATTEDIFGVTARNYPLLVTDNGNGCTLTKTIVVTQPQENLNLTTTRTNVNGCVSLGSITATGSGGTAPYQYSLDDITYQSSETFNNLAGGTYTVFVKDTKGCMDTKQVTIADNGRDPYESNNSKSKAKQISIGENISARIAVANDPADWFSFTTTGAGNYILTLNHPSEAYIFNVYAAGTNTPSLIPLNSTATTKEYVLAANTQYFISVTGDLSFTCYNLSVELPAAFASTVSATVKKTGSFSKESMIFTPDQLSTRVYPNPHQGRFTMQINSPESGAALIQLLTADGRIISTTNKMMAKGNGNTIIFENVKDVIIFYRVVLGKLNVTGKVIKQN